ncbi:MAG: hypothetical protein P8179_20765 [Candidatus Thiodiazotropha sp.]
MTKCTQLPKTVGTLLAAIIQSIIIQPVVAETPVTITIKHFVEGSNPDTGAVDLIHRPDTVGVGDYYGRVRIGDAPFQNNRSKYIENRNFHPNWEFSRTLEADTGIIPVVIQIWDADTIQSNDDIMDLNPADDVQELVLNLDLARCSWSGDTGSNRTVASGDGDHEHFGALEGGESANVWFGIRCGPLDYDRDTLPDDEERFGVFAFEDGEWKNTVNLQGLGADPCRKTILVELDAISSTAPRHDAIQRVVQAFDNAPVPPPLASCPYADHAPAKPGIQLIVDIDDTQLSNRWADAQGNYAINTVALYKRDHFNKAREPYMHYNLWVPNAIPFPGRCCTGERNTDFITEASASGPGKLTADAAIFMHELGHALGLTHNGARGIDRNADGSPDSANCKPNYLSLMNYSFSSGLVDLTTGEVLLDYSRSALPTLNESNLSEQIPLDPTSHLETKWGDVDGDRQRGPVAQRLNWSGDTNSADANIFQTNPVSVDLNNRSIRECGLKFQDSNNDELIQPAELINDPTPGQTLTGHDDWRNLSFKGPLSETAAADPEASLTIEQTHEEQAAVQAEVQATLRCNPPKSGEWIINSDCTIWRDVTAPGDMRIAGGAHLRVAKGVHLRIDLMHHALRVSPGSRFDLLPGARLD